MSFQSVFSRLERAQRCSGRGPVNNHSNCRNCAALVPACRQRIEKLTDSESQATSRCDSYSVSGPYLRCASNHACDLAMTQTLDQLSESPTVVGRIVTVSLMASFFLLAAFSNSSPVEADDSTIDFQRDVAPILEANCLRCHGSDSPEGDFSLSTEAAARKPGLVVAGKPKQSLLLTVVQPDGDQPPAMPQEGKPLTSSEVAVLRQWITPELTGQKE